MKTALIVLGVIFLVLGGLAFTLTTIERDSYLGGLIEDEETVRPYRNFAFPLALAGIVLIVVGAFMEEPRYIIKERR